jgi:hypothetical protein
MSEVELDFQKIGLPIPENIYYLSSDKQKEVYNYLSQMDEIHKKAYLIAKSHLDTSFNILRSNGFKEWKIEQSKK